MDYLERVYAAKLALVKKRQKKNQIGIISENVQQEENQSKKEKIEPQTPDVQSTQL